MRNWIIVGDSDAGYKDCLIKVCCSEEHAREELHKMLSNPDKTDECLMEGCSNFRVKCTEDRNCWWDDPFLVN